MPDSVASRTIGVRELKAHASAVLREVCDTGAEFVISVRGRPVARIEPITGASLEPQVDGMGSSRGKFADWPRLDWAEFVAAKALWRPGPMNET